MSNPVVTKLTQLEHAQIYVGGMLSLQDELVDANNHLLDILSAAQNPPTADGSIDETTYKLLNNLRKSISDLIRASGRCANV